jgi:uncharacterized protein YgbK (DUF1537 family)
MHKEYCPIIVLDDDPTGTQTVHNVPVITEWSIEAISNEFNQKTLLFYILTNSRALIAREANVLGTEIGQNIAKTNQKCWIISRGDSTLRGHFPNEIDALAEGLGWENDYLTILIPAFFEGNRFTKDDIHYLKEGENWIPVGETPYAKDKTFGYHSSNLKDWVEEKTKGKIKALEVNSISIESLEMDSKNTIISIFENTSKVLIVNALSQNHLDRFTEVVKTSTRKIIFRTAASWVASFGNIQKKTLLQKNDFENIKSKNGGLIIVGSHVPKSTAQLGLLLQTDIQREEFNVNDFLDYPSLYLSNFTSKINAYISDNLNVVVFTSRLLKEGANEEESLKLSVRVSEGLINLVKGLSVRPRFFIAKGGITSSDLATKGLGVKRALVLGQIEDGIPVWALDKESKFPNMPYIVFPGNVGNDETLKEIYEKLK